MTDSIKTDCVPLQWSWTVENDGIVYIHDNGIIIAELASFLSLNEAVEEEYANKIVRAVNSHQALVDALQLFMQYAPLSGDMAVLIHGMQGGGEKAAKRADDLVDHYRNLDEARSKAEAALEAALSAPNHTKEPAQ